MSRLCQRILRLIVSSLAVSVVAVYSPTLVQGRSNVQGFKLPISCTPRLDHERFHGQTLSTDVSVANIQQFAYMVQVNVGKQDFFVDLDTGSSDLWIVSTDCLSSDCGGVKKYNKTISTSLSISATPFKLSYLLGSVTGNVAFETVTLGPYEISSQAVALANNTIGLDLASMGNSGILGLSFPSAASISLTSGKTLLENLFSHFDESNRFFAFRLGRDSGLNDQSSSFTVGQLDAAISNDTDDFGFTHVSKAGADNFNYWKLPLRSLIINSMVFPLSKSLVPGAQNPIAVLDTGTTLVLGPTSDVEAFWDAVGHGGAARKNMVTGMWEVRCERGVAVGFVLGDEGSAREYQVDPSDINWAAGGSVDGWCVGGIQANDGVNSGDWLLGGVFLRNVYVSHHGANSTHPPIIGLLGLTDPVSSMNRFRLERGTDSGPLSIQFQTGVSGSSSPHTAIYILSSIGGFVGGAVLTIILRTRLGRGLTKGGARGQNYRR